MNQNTPAESAHVDLSKFDGSSLDRGRSRIFEALWWGARVLIVQTGAPWPSVIRARLLRIFGAKVGHSVYIRPGLRVHFPWKLEIGNNVWIGENTTILNLETVVLEDNTALAHEVYLAAAGHDIRSRSFDYANLPIRIRSGSWVATRAYIGPGVTVGPGAVVAASACVVSDVLENEIVGGVPAKVIGQREIA